MRAALSLLFVILCITLPTFAKRPLPQSTVEKVENILLEIAEIIEITCYGLPKDEYLTTLNKLFKMYFRTINDEIKQARKLPQPNRGKMLIAYQLLNEKLESAFNLLTNEFEIHGLPYR